MIIYSNQNFNEWFSELNTLPIWLCTKDNIYILIIVILIMYWIIYLRKILNIRLDMTEGFVLLFFS